MLSAIPLFNALSDEDMKLVNEIAVEKRVAKNTVVMSERELGDSLYAIVAGRVANSSVRIASTRATPTHSGERHWHSPVWERRARTPRGTTRWLGWLVTHWD